MIGKTYTFGFLAAALIIAPTAAFAQPGQSNEQILNQTATVYGNNNIVNQQGAQLSNQAQFKKGNSPLCNAGNQSQQNSQVINQEAIVLGSGNIVGQNANQQNIQRQLNAAKSYFCR